MNQKKHETLEEYMEVYKSKSSLVRKLFWDRITTSVNFANVSDESVILDVGCSSGNLLKTINVLNSNCECWGIDVENDIMKLDIGNCKFAVCDVKNTSFADKYFTVIFALDTLEHIEDVDDAIKEMQRILRDDGLFILSGPTETWFYKLCRFIQFGMFSKHITTSERGMGSEIDYHFHNIYELEKKLISNGFEKIKQKSLPRYPIPELFRITMYKKKLPKI